MSVIRESRQAVNMEKTVSNLILIQTIKKRMSVEFRLGLVPILSESGPN